MKLLSLQRAEFLIHTLWVRLVVAIAEKGEICHKIGRLPFGSRIERKDLMGAIAPDNDPADFMVWSFVCDKTPAKALVTAPSMAQAVVCIT